MDILLSSLPILLFIPQTSKMAPSFSVLSLKNILVSAKMSDTSVLGMESDHLLF